MKKILNVTLCFLLSITFSKSYSQTVIDYSSWSTGQCNAFYPSTNVNSITHTTTCGTVIYDNTNHAIELDTKADDNIYKGTEYKLEYNFKQGYSYAIKINAWCSTPTYPEPNSKMRVDFSSASNGGGSSCTGVESFNTTSSLTSNNNLQLNPGVYSDYTFQYYSLPVAQGFLYIGGFLQYINGTATSWILIKKITITETPPSVSFTLPASTTFACGTTTPQTFTVTNGSGTTGITDYTWNLGSASNNWLYNGSPAPQTISTGTTGSISLTPVCGKTPGNVYATVTANGSSYNTNTSTVSVTAPSLSIQGNTSFCSDSSVYSLVGAIPCNATVSWIASPSGIVSLSPNGSSVTVTKVGNGIVTLTALINACNNFAVSKQIAIGTPGRPKVFDEMDNEIRTVSICTNIHKSLCPTVDPKWNILEWKWEKITGNFNLLDFQTCGQIIGFQPGSGYISVSVRNACGWSTSNLIVVYITDCSSMAMQEKSIKLFPNPASSSITISVDNQKNAKSTTTDKENFAAASINDVKIYDNFGSVKLYRKFSGQQTASLDVSMLTKGVYMVEVNTGSKVEYQQLIIQR